MKINFLCFFISIQKLERFINRFEKNQKTFLKNGSLELNIVKEQSIFEIEVLDTLFMDWRMVEKERLSTIALIFDPKFLDHIDYYSCHENTAADIYFERNIEPNIKERNLPEDKEISFDPTIKEKNLPEDDKNSFNQKIWVKPEYFSTLKTYISEFLYFDKNSYQARIYDRSYIKPELIGSLIDELMPLVHLFLTKAGTVQDLYDLINFSLSIKVLDKIKYPTLSFTDETIPEKISLIQLSQKKIKKIIEDYLILNGKYHDERKNKKLKSNYSNVNAYELITRWDTNGDHSNLLFINKKLKLPFTLHQVFQINKDALLHFDEKMKIMDTLLLFDFPPEHKGKLFSGMWFSFNDKLILNYSSKQE